MFDDILSMPGQGVDPSTLELCAHQASRLYLDKGVPLTQAVKKIAAEHPEFNDNHLRRVVEKTNNVTFQELFEKSADKNIHFEVADPEKVLTRREVAPAVQAPPLAADYSRSPDAHFNQQLPAKVAADEGADNLWGHSNPIQDVLDEHVRLQGALHTLQGNRASLEDNFFEARGQIQKIARQEILRGNLGLVVSALSKVASDEEVSALVGKVAADLVESGFTSTQELEASLMKVAEDTINPAHPIFVAYDALSKAAEGLAETDLAVKEVESCVALTAQFLRKTAEGLILGAGGKAVRYFTGNGDPMKGLSRTMTAVAAPAIIGENRALGKGISGAIEAAHDPNSAHYLSHRVRT